MIITSYNDKIIVIVCMGLKIMKKSFILALILLVLFSTSYAVSKRITVVLNRTIKIEYNNAIKEFKNVNGVKVYPISFEGTTYLVLLLELLEVVYHIFKFL